MFALISIFTSLSLIGNIKLTFILDISYLRLLLIVILLFKILYFIKYQSLSLNHFMKACFIAFLFLIYR